MATGSDILSYRGNPELAGGYTPEVAARIGDDFEDLNKSFSQLMQQNTAWNANIYKQKIEDRDAVNKLIAESKIDYAVDKDYLPLLQKQLDKIKERRLRTPDIISNPKEYAALQAEIKDFDKMKIYAKTNSKLLDDLRLDYANNPDDTHREKVGGWINDQLNKTKDLKALVQPYQKMVTVTPDIYGLTTNDTVTSTTKDGASTSTASTGGTTTEKVVQKGGLRSIFTPKVMASKTVYENGIPYKEIAEGIDYRDIDNHFNGYNMLNTYGNMVPEQMQAGLDAFKSNPYNTPNRLNYYNRKIDEYNTSQGLTAEEDPGSFIPHIEETLNNPQLFTKAFAVAQQPSVKTSKVVDETLQKALGAKSEIELRKAQGNAANANAAKDYWQISEAKQLLPAKIALMKAQAKEAEMKGDMQNANAYGATDQVSSLIKRTLSQKSLPLQKDIAQYLGVSEKAQIREVLPSDPVGRMILGKPEYDEVDAGKVKGKRTPYKVYMITDEDGTIKFAGLGQNGSWSAAEQIDFKDAPGKLIEYKNDYKLSDGDNKAIGLSYQIMQDNFGGKQTSTTTGNQQGNENIVVPSIKNWVAHSNLNGIDLYQLPDGKWYDSKGIEIK